MTLDLKLIADKCKKIINDPETNLIMLKEIIQNMNSNEEDNKILFIAVLKVFKAVIPLYKVRTLKDKVIHKSDSLDVKVFDKLILSNYNIYISKILSNDTLVSYKCALEIFEHFDHFNNIDKIVGKILKGTLLSSNIRTMCCKALRTKFTEDIKGDITFIIINQMFEKDFDSLVMSYIIEITFLNNFLKDGTVEEAKEKKKRDSFFKYERSGDKKKRKMEKQRRIAENIVKEEEKKEERRDKFVIHRKIVDGLQRLYFLILRDKMKSKFKYTFIGLSIYKKFIRNEFLEGLYVLLNDAIVISDYESKLYGIITTLEIYFQYKYDFKRLVEALYEVINPFNYNLKNEDFNLIEKSIEELFINYKQPIQRVFAIVHRLIVMGCLRYSINVKKIIYNLANVYDIDFSDVYNTKVEEFITNIDNFKNYPFYDYFLFKKLL